MRYCDACLQFGDKYEVFARDSNVEGVDLCYEHYNSWKGVETKLRMRWRSAKVNKSTIEELLPKKIESRTRYSCVD